MVKVSGRVGNASFVRKPDGIRELLSLPSAQDIITKAANKIAAECNAEANSQHGQGDPYAVKTYRNNAGFPHAGIYTATVYGCRNEMAHHTLEKRFR